MALRRSFIRWLAAGTLPLLVIGFAQPSVAATDYTAFSSAAGGFEGSEILDITPDNKYAVMVGANNVGEQKLRIATVDTTNPGVKVDSLDLSTVIGGLGLTRPVASSVAVYQENDSTNVFAVVTIKECSEQCTPPDPVNAGGAVFVRIAANGDLTLVSTQALQLGVQPESIDVAPNGDYAVVANEGIRGNNGTISVIDLRNGPTAATKQVITLATPNAEPEAVTISTDNARAFVTLQENNAVAVLDIDPATLNDLTPTVTNLGNNPATSTPLYPDGIAVTPDGQYIVTADEGITNVHSNTVSMFRVNAADSTLTPVAHSGVFAPGDPRPEMVAIGTVAGQLRAFVSLEGADAVAAFNITTGATPALTLDKIIQLNPSSNGNAGDGPEGIAVVNGLNLVVTANQFSRNISVIRATNTTPTPTPTLDEKVYLPLILNR